MATANELMIDACVSGFACLDKRELLVVTAQSYSGGASAEALMESACANGFECLNKRELLVAIAQALNT